MPAAHVWNPTEGIVERANVARFMRAHGISTYHELVSRSTSDIAWFWQAVVDDLGIQFFRPYDTLLDLSRGVPWSRWFIGGADKPCRSLPGSARPVGAHERIAVAWEGEDGAIRRLSYAELHGETCRLANALKRLSIVQGERVGLFLPMVPEAVVAFLACAKIGAIVVPIFSGFGAQGGRGSAERLPGPGDDHG